MTTQDENSESSNKTLLRRPVPEWSLKSNNPGGKDQIFPLWSEHFVGREDCEILLTGAHSSRKHARLTLSNGVLRVEDLNSANGTFVNGNKIETAVLKDGDIVRFDMQEFTVVGSNETAKTMLRPASDPEQAVKKTPHKDRTAENTPRKKAAASKSSRKKVAVSKSPRKKVVAEKEPSVDSPPTESSSAESQATTDDAITAATGDVRGEHNTLQETRVVRMNDLAEQIDKGETRELDPNELREQLVKGALTDDENPLHDIATEGVTRVAPNAGRVKMPALLGTVGVWKGRVFNLSGEAMTIGRAGVDIILNEPSVSTKHAQIINREDRWKVVDLMSANGVYVNGKKTQASFLSSGDTVRFGRLELRFVIDSADTSSTISSGEEQIITSASRNSGNKVPAWQYVAIGFVVVLAIGTYVLFYG